jgi:hypothetical protein
MLKFVCLHGRHVPWRSTFLVFHTDRANWLPVIDILPNLWSDALFAKYSSQTVTLASKRRFLFSFQCTLVVAKLDERPMDAKTF